MVVAVPAAACTFVALCLAGCIARPPSLGSVSVTARLEMFPREGLPLHAPARVYFNDDLVPFIDAEHDLDVPLLMGVVHAYLRLGQMEMVRRVSQGRVTEMVGPLASDVDHLIRMLDFGRASTEMQRSLPPETAAWVERYVEGINAFRRLSRVRPAEFVALALSEEDWTVADVLTIGRLAAADVNWLSWASYLNLRGEPGWEEWWGRMTEWGAAASPSFGPDDPLQLIASLGKSGSNCFAIAGSRTVSGAAIIASDPHVGFTIPSFWVILGYASPSSNVLGLTMPGLPVVLEGRNERIAWGATNMQALNSSLYDVSGLEATSFRTRRERLTRRFFLNSSVTIRDTDWGPVLTDASAFSKAAAHGPVTLRWRGHEPSDELSAFLRASRAGNWEEFRQAFRTYAVSGQNVLYGDIEGNIGQLLAVEFDPAAGRTALAGLGDPRLPEHQWGVRYSSTELPHEFNPACGYLVSANNIPVRTDPPLTIVANADDRYERMRDMIEAFGTMTWADAAAIQTDVYSAVSHRLAGMIVHAAHGTSMSTRAARVLEDLAAWDGEFKADSRGALVHQAILARLIIAAYEQNFGGGIARMLRSSPAAQPMLIEDLANGKLDIDWADLLDRAAADAPEGRVWGDVHRMRLAHWLGNVPVIGASYRFGEIGVDGSTTTVLKTAHRATASRHYTSFGASARHVSDLSDPDENYFVLMGGQDGWLGSEHLIDQVERWRAGELIRIPMRPESVRATFATVFELSPGQAGPPSADR